MVHPQTNDDSLTRLDPRGMSPPGRRLPNREANKLRVITRSPFCSGSIRAGGFQMTKNQKSDEKRGSLKLRSQVLKAQIRGTVFWELEK